MNSDLFVFAFGFGVTMIVWIGIVLILIDKYYVTLPQKRARANVQAGTNR